MFQWLVPAILAPFVGALVIPFFKGKKINCAVVFFATLNLVFSLLVIAASFHRKETILLYRLPWLESGTFQFGFLLDPLSSLLLIAISVIGFLVALYSTGYLSEKNREHPTGEGKERYYFFLFLFIGAMTGVVTSPNLLQTVVFWELTTLCSWGLISHHGNQKALQSGYKALLITGACGLFLMAATVVLFVNTHSFDFAAIKQLEPSARYMVVLFILIAAWAKAAQFPFFTWLPTAMAAPTPASAYLHAAAMVKAGVYLAARIIVEGGLSMPEFGLLVAVMAVVTMYVALIFYFVQDDLKRLLAFSTIAHLSIMFLGMGLGVMGSALAMKGGLLHLINHAFAKGLLFLAAGAVTYATGTKSMRELSGIGKRMPVTTAAFIAGAMAISGVPPFNGFWSKFYIVAGALQLNTAAGWAAGLLLLAESIIGFAWFLVVIHRVFFGDPSSRVETAADPPWPMLAPLLVLIVFTVVSPLFGIPLVNNIVGGF